MVDLRANAIITAVDRFSGPVQRMAGAINGFVAGTAAAAQRINAAGIRMSAAPAALATTMLLERTQEFEKYALGTKIAGIPDAFKEIADEFGRMHRMVDWGPLNQEQEKFRKGALQLSKDLGLMPTQMMRAEMAASKMGMTFRESQALARQAGIWSMADDEMPSDQRGRVPRQARAAVQRAERSRTVRGLGQGHSRQDKGDV